MSERRKLRAFKRGQRAELFAALWLRVKGFRIVAKRYKTRNGEVDLIARRGALVLIVEVKARPTLTAAIEAVSVLSQQRIEAAATHWLARQADHDSLSLRFDVIAVLPRRLPVHIPAFFTIDNAHQ